MLSRGPIVDSSTKKRPIQPYLMVWKDTSKTIGGDGILEIRTKPPNPSRDIEWRVFLPLRDLKKVLFQLKVHW